jgi:hypothetical protein
MIGGLVVVAIVYASTVMRLSLLTDEEESNYVEIKSDRYRLKEMEHEMGAQMHVIDTLMAELNKTREESLGEMKSLREALNAHGSIAAVHEAAATVTNSKTLPPSSVTPPPPAPTLPPPMPPPPPPPPPTPTPPLLPPPPPPTPPPPPPPPPTLKPTKQGSATGLADYGGPLQALSVGAPLSMAEDPDAEIAQKRRAVKEAMVHSWEGYKTFAWGDDELQPLSKKGKNWLNVGATIVDGAVATACTSHTRACPHQASDEANTDTCAPPPSFTSVPCRDVNLQRCRRSS